MAKKIDIIIGETYYYQNQTYDLRCGYKYHRIVVTGEDDRTWRCGHGCTINKRSKMMTARWNDRYEVFTTDEVMRAQWFERWHREIVKHIQPCKDYEILRQITDILGMDAPLVDPVVDERGKW